MLNFYDYLKTESINHTIERIDDDEDGVMLIYTWTRNTNNKNTRP